MNSHLKVIVYLPYSAHCKINIAAYKSIACIIHPESSFLLNHLSYIES